MTTHFARAYVSPLVQRLRRGGRGAFAGGGAVSHPAWTGIRDLSGLRDVPAVTRLDLRSCGRLAGLAGIAVMPDLTELLLADCPRLKTVHGLGIHPRVKQLEITGCAELADLSVVSALTNLTGLNRLNSFPH